MIRMKRFLILQVFGALIAAMAQAATNFDLAAQATNELAVDLHRQLATGNENLCVSPYSIESALAMTFAGADGETRTEMARDEREDDGTRKRSQKIRRPERTNHARDRQSAVCAKGLRLSSGFPVSRKTKLRRGV